MQILITGHSGGYQETHWDVDAVPRVGERLRVWSRTGRPWEGIVENVTHVAVQNRPDEVVAEVELAEHTLHERPELVAR
jgi:hypothetical protein